MFQDEGSTWEGSVAQLKRNIDTAVNSIKLNNSKNFTDVNQNIEKLGSKV